MTDALPTPTIPLRRLRRTLWAVLAAVTGLFGLCVVGSGSQGGHSTSPAATAVWWVVGVGCLGVAGVALWRVIRLAARPAPPLWDRAAAYLLGDEPLPAPRELQLSRAVAGDPLRVDVARLNLAASEFAYFHRRAVVGADFGHLLISNRGLTFVAPQTGDQVPWASVQEIFADDRWLGVSTSTSRGTVYYRLADPHVAHAVALAALRIARRLTDSPAGERASRHIPPALRAEVWHRDGGRCQECGGGEQLEIGWIVPRSRGGARSAENLQVICHDCRKDKGDRV